MEFIIIPYEIFIEVLKNCEINTIFRIMLFTCKQLTMERNNFWKYIYTENYNDVKYCNRYSWYENCKLYPFVKYLMKTKNPEKRKGFRYYSKIYPIPIIGDIVNIPVKNKWFIGLVVKLWTNKKSKLSFDVILVHRINENISAKNCEKSNLCGYYDYPIINYKLVNKRKINKKTYYIEGENNVYNIFGKYKPMKYDKQLSNVVL